MYVQQDQDIRRAPAEREDFADYEDSYGEPTFALSLNHNETEVFPEYEDSYGEPASALSMINNHNETVIL